jgi:hypothetical protein
MKPSLGVPFLSPPTLRGVLWDNKLTHLWFSGRILLEETPIFVLPFLISDANNAVYLGRLNKPRELEKAGDTLRPPCCTYNHKKSGILTGSTDKIKKQVKKVKNQWTSCRFLGHLPKLLPRALSLPRAWTKSPRESDWIVYKQIMVIKNSRI